jgi:hypothetical protein
MHHFVRLVATFSLILMITARAQAENGVPEGSEDAAPKAASDATASRDGLKPGDVLNQSNWQLAKDLLPPEILEHYKTGAYVNRIVDWPVGEYDWAPEFREATKNNDGKYDIGDKGHIIEKSTGEQPLRILGYPFPNIDPKDPKAASKILWNFFYITWYYGNLHVESQVNWLAPDGLERRTDQDVSFLFYDGQPERYQIPNEENFLSKQLVKTLYPADLHGTSALSWRYRDPNKRDSAWAFVPALRRVRAVSPANRSDGFLGSDMSQDDGPFFDGKVEDFTWTLEGEVDQLRIVEPLNIAGKSNAVWLPEGGWRAIWADDLKQFGYQDPNWKGFSWAPISMALAERRLWVISGVPKDRYYLYGRIQLYLDKETYQGSWNRKFSWQGELLNTLQVQAYKPHKYTRPDGQVDYIQGSNSSFQLAENIKANRATSAGQKTSSRSALDSRVTYPKSYFDTSTMNRVGK